LDPKIVAPEGVGKNRGKTVAGEKIKRGVLFFAKQTIRSCTISEYKKVGFHDDKIIYQKGNYDWIYEKIREARIRKCANSD